MKFFEIENALLNGKNGKVARFFLSIEAEILDVRFTRDFSGVMHPGIVAAASEIFLLNGDSGRARKLLKVILGAWPEAVWLRLRLAKILVMEGDSDGAELERRRAALLAPIGPNVENAAKGLVDLLSEKQGQSSGVSTADLINLSVTADSGAEHQLLDHEVRSFFGEPSIDRIATAIAKQSPRLTDVVSGELLHGIANPLVLRSVASKLMSMSSPEAASRCFEALVRGWPLRATARQEAAIAHDYAGNGTLAFKRMKESLVLSPALARSAKNLATFLQESGEDGDASRIFKWALAINPKNWNARFGLRSIEVEARAINKDNRRLKAAKWPRHFQEFRDLDDSIRRFVIADVREEPLLRPGTRLFAMGSCFARHLADRLKEQAEQIDVDFLFANEEINNTYAGRYLVETLIDPHSPHRDMVEGYFGSSYLDTLRRTLKKIDVVVYTMGVAPGFFDLRTGSYVIPNMRERSARQLTRDFEFRSTSVEENAENVRRVIDGLSRFNPSMRFVLTVSPVPLSVSLEFASPMVADCLSKSTLRVAADQIVREYGARTIYWPSFEIVRWLGPEFGRCFGAEDSNTRHVSNHVVDRIVAAFLERLSSTG